VLRLYEANGLVGVSETLAVSESTVRETIVLDLAS
jgi:hypothetical protein